MRILSCTLKIFLGGVVRSLGGHNCLLSSLRILTSHTSVPCVISPPKNVAPTTRGLVRQGYCSQIVDNPMEGLCIFLFNNYIQGMGPLSYQAILFNQVTIYPQSYLHVVFFEGLFYNQWLKRYVVTDQGSKWTVCAHISSGLVVGSGSMFSFSLFKNRAMLSETFEASVRRVLQQWSKTQLKWLVPQHNYMSFKT